MVQTSDVLACSLLKMLGAYNPDTAAMLEELSRLSVDPFNVTDQSLPILKNSFFVFSESMECYATHYEGLQ